MEHIEAKHVIIGAGAMGSAAAYQLARRGEPVLVIEQFKLGHDRGSSHGAARITRHSYADARYARLMPAAFRAWRDLEADSGETLYFRTGGVSFSPPEVDYVARVVANLDELAVPHWQGSGRDWNRRYPVYALPDDYVVVFEPDAGMLKAARAVALQIELARAYGQDKTQVIEDCPVRRIDLDQDHPIVITDRARIVADRLIVSAGAWINRLLPHLPVSLRPTRQQVLYLRPNDCAPFHVGTFPVFFCQGAGSEDSFYGMPGFQELGVKVARHGGPECDPDVEDRTIGEAYQATVRQFLRDHLPSLALAPIDRTEVCLYTIARDDQFQVDFLADRRDVVVASPCSGHGFKFSCMMGCLLADMVMTAQTTLPVEPWRFAPIDK